jgi:hypothetical protein
MSDSIEGLKESTAYLRKAIRNIRMACVLLGGAASVTIALIFLVLATGPELQGKSFWWVLGLHVWCVFLLSLLWYSIHRLKLMRQALWNCERILERPWNEIAVAHYTDQAMAALKRL